jgi:ABC-type branched-subunit amino acid transport system substrate-binding protein
MYIYFLGSSSPGELASGVTTVHIVEVSSRTRRLLGLGVLAIALAVPSACGGSTLSPQAVKAANDKAGGASAAGSTLGSTVGTTSGGTTTGGTTTGGTTTGGTTTAGTTTVGTTTGGTKTGGTTTGGTTTGGGGTSAAPAVKAGSCAGFKNQKGITNSTISIGNSSDISGPVPGLFTGAQQATKAYIAYFNATSNICGRKLALTNLDSRTDAGADQTSYQTMCDSDFASVGSMSAFDSGGAGVAQGCGQPDMRAIAVTADRNNCSTCFGAEATGPHEFSNEVPDFYVHSPTYHAASQKAAFLYLNAGAAAENAVYQQKVEVQRGMKFVYTSGIDVADFNYGPYVQQMISKGVQWVQFIGAYQQSVRLDQAMAQAGFHPQVRLHDPSVYDQGYLQIGGPAIEGVHVYINFTPIDENQAELNLYKNWLQQVAPGAYPTFFGEFAWSAAKLFVEQAIKLGGSLTRASLVSAIKGIHAWTGGGMHSPMDVGGKHSPSCIRFMQVKNDKFVPLGSKEYTCHGSSVGR